MNVLRCDISSSSVGEETVPLVRIRKEIDLTPGLMKH